MPNLTSPGEFSVARGKLEQKVVYSCSVGKFLSISVWVLLLVVGG